MAGWVEIAVPVTVVAPGGRPAPAARDAAMARIANGGPFMQAGFVRRVRRADTCSLFKAFLWNIRQLTVPR